MNQKRYFKYRDPLTKLGYNTLNEFTTLRKQ